jgi:hypothetical protein
MLDVALDSNVRVLCETVIGVSVALVVANVVMRKREKANKIKKGASVPIARADNGMMLQTDTITNQDNLSFARNMHTLASMFGAAKLLADKYDPWSVNAAVYNTESQELDLYFRNAMYRRDDPDRPPGPLAINPIFRARIAESEIKRNGREAAKSSHAFWKRVASKTD